MIEPALYGTTTLVKIQNPCECFCVFLLVPVYIAVGTLVSSSTAEGDVSINSPGQC